MHDSSLYDYFWNIVSTPLFIYFKEFTDALTSRSEVGSSSGLCTSTIQIGFGTHCGTSTPTSSCTPSPTVVTSKTTTILTCPTSTPTTSICTYSTTSTFVGTAYCVPAPTGTCTPSLLTQTFTGTTTAPCSTITPPPSPSNTQTLYGQCGGSGYSGPEICAPPYTCSPVAPTWYSQIIMTVSLPHRMTMVMPPLLTPVALSFLCISQLYNSFKASADKYNVFVIENTAVDLNSPVDVRTESVNHALFEGPASLRFLLGLFVAAIRYVSESSAGKWLLKIEGITLYLHQEGTLALGKTPLKTLSSGLTENRILQYESILVILALLVPLFFRFISKVLRHAGLSSSKWSQWEVPRWRRITDLRSSLHKPLSAEDSTSPTPLVTPAVLSPTIIPTQSASPMDPSPTAVPSPNSHILPTLLSHISHPSLSTDREARNIQVLEHQASLAWELEQAQSQIHSLEHTIKNLAGERDELQEKLEISELENKTLMLKLVIYERDREHVEMGPGSAQSSSETEARSGRKEGEEERAVGEVRMPLIDRQGVDFGRVEGEESELSDSASNKSEDEVRNTTTSVRLGRLHDALLTNIEMCLPEPATDEPDSAGDFAPLVDRDMSPSDIDSIAENY
ncbi:hypothetical protein SISNIDRAFT_486958 [Sistotremastrum niveocremeum HHB9708]|uniref:CBM1 domain-containing protein n=1 Tax=Sistotremastrum niveocremeum HHB9708 TaxID=1314777 RepID=A0A164T2H9_9AGAM|nr:hypothetical protein SISNIDRAFT_486958 [Sistotremastrum niveocremeum HHB9708]